MAEDRENLWVLVKISYIFRFFDPRGYTVRGTVGYIFRGLEITSIS